MIIDPEQNKVQEQQIASNKTILPKSLLSPKSTITNQSYPIHTDPPQNSFTMSNHPPSLDPAQPSFLAPGILPYQLNTQQIMQTIWSTEQLIKRTKLYVQNIPIKTDFYQSTIGESRRSNEDYINRDRYYEVGRLRVSRDRREEYEERGMDKSTERFQKSPTPVERLTEFEFEIDYSDINSDQKPPEKYHYSSITHQPTRKPKPLSLIQETQQTYNNIKQTDPQNIQTFRPVGWKSPKNASIPIELKSPKNISILDNSNYIPKDIVSTGAKTPRTKTFEAYAAYNEEHHSNPHKKHTHAEIKQNKDFLVFMNPQQTKITHEEPIRYFKKQVGRNQPLSASESDDKIKQRRHQRTKIISTILESHRSNQNQQDNTIPHIQITKSEYATPFQKSPRITKPQPYRYDHDQKIQTQGAINFRTVNAMTEPRSTKSRKGETSTQKSKGKWAKKNTPVNPFQSIQQEYEQKAKAKQQKSPNKFAKTYNKNFKNPLSPKNIAQTPEKRNQLPSKRESFHKTTENYFSAKKDSPDVKQYHSIQINMQNSVERPQAQNIHIDQGERQRTKSKKKHGITVLLNSSSPKNSIKIEQTQYNTSINPFQMTVSQQSDSNPHKKRSIEISIQNNGPTQNHHKNIKYIETPLQQYHQKVNLSITPLSRNSQKHSLAERINLQLNRLQVLNHVDNQIYLRESGKSKERSPRKSLRTGSSKKFQRNGSQAYETQKQSKNVSEEQLPQEADFKRYPTNIINRQRLKINQINNLTIYPSSLQKYKSSNNISHQSSPSFKTPQNLNNTFCFTPQKKKPDQVNVPKSHIINLQNSMKNLMSNSQEKSISSKRKKIFDSREKSNKKYRTPQNLFINPLRAKELYRKEFENHNKTLEAKLYNFLVEEDSVSKRATQKKRKFSPSRNGRKSSNRKYSKIFESYASSVQKSQCNSPRLQPIKSLFKYTPAKQSYQSTLMHSVQNFEQSIRVDSLDKPVPLSEQKLNEQEIRQQIKRIKEYEFVEKYMTNFELEKLMRGYIHKRIPARKWVVLVVDQVYKRIRSQKEKSKLYGLVG